MMVSHLIAATIELFAADDIPVQCSSSTALAPLLATTVSAATIGYVGDDVHGALTLLATERTVQAWIAATGSELSDLHDALGEYANMLLGRLKGRLLLEGLPILMATPTSTPESDLRVSALGGQSTWLTFDAPDWQAAVRLDANFEPGFRLEAPSDRERPMEAGEALLF